MKKIIAGTTLLSLAFLSAQAQITAGTKSVSGSIGYYSSKSETSVAPPSSNTNSNSNTSFNLTPTISYFVAENLALGLSASLSIGQQQYTQYYSDYTGSRYANIEEKSRGFSIAPVARYYKFLGDKVAIYGQLSAGYSNDKNVSKSSEAGFNSTIRHGNGYGAALSPGIVFFPTEKIGLEVYLGGLGYSHASTKLEGFDYKTVDNHFNFGFGISNLNFGAAIYLGR